QKLEEDRRSLWTICHEVEARWRKKEGYAGITVSRDTVRRRLNGGQSQHQFNMENNAWLTNKEEGQMIAFCLDLATRGFPLNHRSLKLHVDNIIHAWIGMAFPEAGVGTNWIQRFLERHTARLGRYWSAPLDTAHGRAVNEHTNRAWFNLLGGTIKAKDIG
ncbi:hypothetical protein PAXINDRAFT_82509, partial [Paxillus involutus ATCC 200175]